MAGQMIVNSKENKRKSTGTVLQKKLIDYSAKAIKKELISKGMSYE